MLRILQRDKLTQSHVPVTLYITQLVVNNHLTSIGTLVIGLTYNQECYNLHVYTRIIIIDLNNNFTIDTTGIQI